MLKTSVLPEFPMIVKEARWFGLSPLPRKIVGIETLKRGVKSNGS